MPIPLIDDHCERWVAVYDNAEGYEGSSGIDNLVDVAATANTVIATGWSWSDVTDGYDFLTVAYVTLAYGSNLDAGYRIAVTPDGERVVVTGAVGNSDRDNFYDYGTLVVRVRGR